MSLVKLITAHPLAWRLRLVSDELKMFRPSVCSSSMMIPIGAALGVLVSSKVETIVSKIMPFENPKSVISIMFQPSVNFHSRIIKFCRANTAPQLIMPELNSD